jgi:hypothetical protein
MPSLIDIEVNRSLENLSIDGTLGLGLGPTGDEKKGAHPARVAEAGRENIETVHEPKPIQAVITLCMDKVAVLWRVPTAHKPG